MRSNEREKIEEQIEDYEDLIEEANRKSKKSNGRTLKLLLLNAIMSLGFPIGIAIPKQNMLPELGTSSPIREAIADNIGWLGDLLVSSPFVWLSLIGVMGGVLTCGYLIANNLGYGVIKKIANSKINSLNNKLSRRNYRSLEREYSKDLYKTREKKDTPVYSGYNYTNRRTSHQENDVEREEDYYYKMVDNKLVRVKRKKS